MGSLVAELAEKLSSATNNFDIDEGTMYVNTSADTVGIGTTNPASKLDVQGTMQVGVNDTGHDVTFYGAAAGSFALWDESANEFQVRGGAGGFGKLKLSTAETTVVDGNKLGQIEFQAPLDSAGTDAILVGASIHAEADATFSASVNSTDLVFSTGDSEAAAEKMRITSDGKVGIGTTNPTEMLEVYNATAPSIQLNDGGDYQALFKLVGNDLEIRGSSGVMEFYTGNADGDSSTLRMVIKADGKVGIGTTTPGNLLNVVGTADNAVVTALQLENTDWASSETGQGVMINFKLSQAGTAQQDAAQIIVGKDSPWHDNAARDAHIAFKTTEDATMTERVRISHDGKVGIGSSAPNKPLEVAHATDPVIRLTRADSTIVADENLGSIQFSGDDPATDTTGAIIQAKAASAWASNDYATSLLFYTTADNSGSLTERLRILHDGKVGIGSTAPPVPLCVEGAGAGGNGLVRFNCTDGTGTPEGLLIDYTNTTPDDTGWSYYFQDSTAGRFIVRNDGDVQNHDNSYSQLSDVRIKQGIRDANSQWDDVKAVRVRNFTRKDDAAQYGDKAWEQIGVIAQEVEKISPKLIKENPPGKFELEHCGFGEQNEDGEWVPKKDENGKDMTVKSMKYSILQMKAFKALQEAMAKIETLEAKVKALEDA